MYLANSIFRLFQKGAASAKSLIVFQLPPLRIRLKSIQRGASLVEYTLLVALLAIFCLVAMQSLTKSVSQQFSSVTSQMS